MFKLNQQKNHNLNDNNNCNCKLLQKETTLMPILEDIIIWQNSSILGKYINKIFTKGLPSWWDKLFYESGLIGKN